MDLADSGPYYGYIFFDCLFHNASKECFWPKNGLKSAILEQLKNCQNGTFEPMYSWVPNKRVGWKSASRVGKKSKNANRVERRLMQF
jgi:hypothetical protein